MIDLPKERPMQRKRKRVLISVPVLLVLVALWVYWFNPEWLPSGFRNDSARCVGCGCFISSSLDQFLMDADDGWLPRGGTTPADSLSVLVKWSGHAAVFTSHSLTPKLEKYFREHGTMHYDYMCYRYNEGLRADDPEDLIIMYYYKPTRWENSHRKRDFVGRPIMTFTTRSAWDFIPEAEFQRRQNETEEYLRKNNRTGAAAATNCPSMASIGKDRIVELVTVQGEIYKGEIRWHPYLRQYHCATGGIWQVVQSDQVKYVTLETPAGP